tara:strand:- start:457 stop:1020 length:564 start_codon:yes stop_codon:yes gene_type:complete
MSDQNLIIYNFISLYKILEEINLDLNFNVIYVDSQKSLNDKIKKINNYLVISNRKDLNVNNQVILDILPMSMSSLIEKINIQFLKLQFNNQSRFKIKKYFIDLNSREIILNKIKLKLTEKETKIITYLSKEKKPVTIEELEENVWSYQSDIETHTVETHIYRLRKKILSTFNDNDFILSEKNGYQIK